MIKFEKTIFINRPQQVVFEYVSNPANDPEWQSTIDASAWASPGPAGVGSKVNSTGKFMGRKMDTTAEITTWNPPDQFAFKSTSGPFPFEFSMKLVTEQGGTRLSLVGTAEVGGFFKLAEGLVAKQAEKQFADDLETLKKVMEAA